MDDFPEIYVKAWLMPSKVLSGTNWIIYIAVFLVGLVFLFRSQPGAADIFITLVIILASAFVWLTSWGGITGNLPLIALVYFVLILLLLLRKRRHQRHEAAV
jgi:hypothetical protein